MAAAQTGTGKTASFTLPMLQRLAAGPPVKKNHIRALVLRQRENWRRRWLTALLLTQTLVVKIRRRLWRGEYQPANQEITRRC